MEYKYKFRYYIGVRKKYQLIYGWLDFSCEKLLENFKTKVLTIQKTNWINRQRGFQCEHLWDFRLVFSGLKSGSGEKHSCKSE